MTRSRTIQPARSRRWLGLMAVVVALVVSRGWSQQRSNGSADWPQLQHDAARSGHTSAMVKPPYRARWIWMGSDWVLRNADSEDGQGWKDDLRSREGHDLRMPEEVDFSFAGGMQPIVKAGRVFVADMQGRVYALDLDDGRTLWTGRQPGGSMFSGVAWEGHVAFASVCGRVTCWDADTGRRLWQHDTKSSITHSPVWQEGAVYVANHEGKVICIDGASGEQRWQVDVGAPVHGGMCIRDGMLYLGNEAVEAVAIDLAAAKVTARRKVMGQGFRLTWPVAAGDRVIFSAFALVHGSEYVNDPVFSGVEDPGWEPGLKSIHEDYLAEQRGIRAWLASDEGRYYETTYALSKRTLSKDYIVAVGATEGCGMPPNPPALDAHGRPILWWATAHPTLGPDRVFGSNFTMDLSHLDLETGLRSVIHLPKRAHARAEVDNLFGLTIGGHMLYARQNFRGTYTIDLEKGRKHWISAAYRHRDGGDWPAPVNYANGSKDRGRNWPADMVRLPRTPAGGQFKGRPGPTIVDGRILFTEFFGVTCVEQEKN